MYHTLTKRQSLVFALIFFISLSLVAPQATYLVSASSSVTYSGNLSLTTTVIAQDDEYNYPDQKLTRTCVVSCPFSDLTLTSYDGGSTYSGTIYNQQGTYTSDWSISPASSTSSVGVTRAFAPASGHTSASFSMQIYAEIKGGVLTFIFNPASTLLQTQISTTYSYATQTQPPGTATAVTYTSSASDAYTTLLTYSTTESSLVNVPKSSNPFQTQTISFSGSHISQSNSAKSFDWTGTISLNAGNQVTETPNPDNNQNEQNNTNDDTTPQPTVTPSKEPIDVSQPEVGTAQISNLNGDIQVTKAGSNNPQTVTGPTTLNVGDRVRAGANSWVTITYSDGSKLDLAPGCEVTIEDSQDDNQYKNVRLLNGLIHLWEEFQSGGRKFKVHTIAFALAIRGSELTIEANGTGITVIVIDGTVDVENVQTSDIVTLEAGQTLSLTNDMSEQQMQQNIQSMDSSTINRWWDQAYQGVFTGTTIAILGAIAIIAIVAVALAVLMVRRRKRLVNSTLPPPPPPPPPT